jgi:hypothetical protein
MFMAIVLGWVCTVCSPIRAVWLKVLLAIMYPALMGFALAIFSFSLTGLPRLF